MSELLDKQATLYEQAAHELDLAAKHLRVTAEHFRNKEVPRACAHVLASQGHLLTVQKIIEEHAILHASKARA
jgi:CHAD domain-containing protein